MIKKYQEFLETEMEIYDDRIDKSYILTISGYDLDADYYFHKNITPLIGEAIKYFEFFAELQDSPDREARNDAMQKYSDHGLKVTSSVEKYLTEELKYNGLVFEAYYLHVADNISGYILRFLGTKSDLEKINKYYGIVGDINIKEYKNDFGRGWKYLK